MSPSTTFISCLFVESEISYLDKWIESNLPMVIFVPKSMQETVQTKTVKTQQITVHVLPPIEEASYYDKEITLLPDVRNKEKDTLAHLWNMHTKILAMKTVVGLINKKENHYYAYVDFDLPRLFRQEEEENTWKYLTDTFTKPGLYVEESSSTRMFIPGCWSKNPDVSKDNVCWRFCGPFLFGSAKAIAEFYGYYESHFLQKFIKESCAHKMTWEVNFWAWLEMNSEWNPVWYQADHTDSIVVVPKIYPYQILKKTPGCKIVEYQYPNLSPYRPMSAAYVMYQGKEWLNTRFVNYWIYDNGSYYYPEDEQVIRTLNVCSPLIITKDNVPIPVKYELMQHLNDSSNTNNNNVNVKNGFSKGIEDVRLYVSQETGKLCFIGSTLQYSNCDKIRMIRGIYDVETHMLREMQVINPPQETWCEKNWSPIPLPDGRTDGFVYTWYPFCEIGKVNKETGKLEICVRNPMDERFRGMKGSTPFVPYSLKQGKEQGKEQEEGLIGVIHFSEERTPRQYFHRVVVLDRKTYEVVKCSEIFCFNKASVEFCIGFRYRRVEETFGFWISQMDREPMYLEIPARNIFM